MQTYSRRPRSWLHPVPPYFGQTNPFDRYFPLTQTFYLFYRPIPGPLFQTLEKAPHNNVVIEMTLGRKVLDHAQFVDDLAEVPGGKLTTLICMEHDTFGNVSQPYSVPQGINCQEAINFGSNPAGDNPSGKILDGQI